jgi:glycosyltransferase involved in cell wall biosynthesis
LASKPSLRDPDAPDLAVAARRADPARPRVLLVNYSDGASGAGRAAHRLLRGLRGHGLNAHMLAVEAVSGDAAVRGLERRSQRLVQTIREPLDRLPLHLLRPGRAPVFSPAWVPDGLARRIAGLSPDLVHLHWIGGGMARIESLSRLDRPLVWTMHDMWPFTGGCHYDGGCGRHADACGRCPVLGSGRAWDLSRWVLNRKKRAWRGLPLTLVAPSRWLAERAKASRLFRDHPVRVIPNGLDLDLFQPIDRALARRLLGLPQDRLHVLFGAADPGGEVRKGFGLLRSALLSLAERGWRDRVDLLVAGPGPAGRGAELGLRARFLGRLQDEISMAVALAAADVVVVPSSQDNLPNMAVEALACGRPCVGFAVGGLPDIVDDGRNGRLAAPLDPEDLAAAIAWVLDDDGRRQSLGREARRKAEQTFDIGTVAQRYADLYAEVAGQRPTPRT